MSDSAKLPEPVRSITPETPVADVAQRLAQAANARWSVWAISPIQGDASVRKYYRVHLEPHEGVPSTVVLMQMNNVGRPLGSEEATEGEGPAEDPFCSMDRHLLRAGVLVPEIYFQADAVGYLLIQDFGDLSLYGFVKDGFNFKGEMAYEAAVRVMARFHARGSDRSLGDCTGFHQQFSEKLFLWEFDHYLEYGIEVRLGKKLTDGDREKLASVFVPLVKRLFAEPQVLTHRDYHSKNLMVLEDGRIGVIDFQDSLMGPDVYDLASLLRDAYVTVPELLVDRLVSIYAETRAQEQKGYVLDREKFSRLFVDQAIQRNMKALGRFVYIDRVKNNPGYLPFIPRLQGFLKTNLTSRPEYAPAWEVLSRLDPELAGA